MYAAPTCLKYFCGVQCYSNNLFITARFFSCIVKHVECLNPEFKKTLLVHGNIFNKSAVLNLWSAADHDWGSAAICPVVREKSLIFMFI